MGGRCFSHRLGADVGYFQCQCDLSSVELPWKPTPTWAADVLHFMISWPSSLQASRPPPGTDLTIIALLLDNQVRSV
jgi:hypothetical protein